jgi:hypothetical protein
MRLNEIYDSVVAEGSSALAEVIAVLEQAGMRYAVIGGLATTSTVSLRLYRDSAIRLSDVLSLEFSQSRERLESPDFDRPRAPRISGSIREKTSVRHPSECRVLGRFG